MSGSAGNFEARLPAGRCARIAVSGETIETVSPIAEDESLPYALPVLVDLQHNGALGTYYTVMDEHGLEPMERIIATLRQHGVGRCQLTVTTYEIERLKRTLRLLDGYLDGHPDAARLFFGFFQEGIFISPEDGWRGSHVRDWVRAPDYDCFEELNEAAGGRIGMVNVAPEEPGGLEFVTRAVGDGQRVAIGHCSPSPEVVREAAKRGARFVTHFGNGASPTVHRFKNPFWAFLDGPELRLGLICDGHHLPPEVVRVALRCKGPAGCWPVSDASGYSGLPSGEHESYGGRRFVIEPDRRIHLAGSELMMGAWFQQDRCVEFLTRHTDMSFLEAWRQCSETPAGLAGLVLPRIAPGEEASFVLARWDDGLVIEQSVHLGTRYLDRPIRPSDPARV